MLNWEKSEDMKVGERERERDNEVYRTGMIRGGVSGVVSVRMLLFLYFDFPLSLGDDCTIDIARDMSKERKNREEKDR